MRATALIHNIEKKIAHQNIDNFILDWPHSIQITYFFIILFQIIRYLKTERHEVYFKTILSRAWLEIAYSLFLYLVEEKWGYVLFPLTPKLVYIIIYLEQFMSEFG